MADMAWNIKCREEDMEFRRRELQWRKEEARGDINSPCHV